MLRPGPSCSLWRLSRPRLWSLHVCARPCSSSSSSTTLGEVQSYLKRLREKARLQSGTVQLCLSEDMRVTAEHWPNFDGSFAERRCTQVGTVWQGSTTSTLREALEHLISEGGNGKVDGAAASPAPSPVGGPRPASSAPSQFSLTQHRRAPFSAPSPPSHATVVDLSRISTEETRNVVRYLEKAYPLLRLRVRHTTGRDLQGITLHTISVEMTPRLARDGRDGSTLSSAAVLTPLPEELQRLVDSFRGESAGEGYNGCLRRALRDAFAHVNLPYPPTSDSTDGMAAAATSPLSSLFSASSPAQASVLSLYAQTWTQDGYGLHVGEAASDDTVTCEVRHRVSGQLRGSTKLPRTAAGLRDLLTFCAAVAAQGSPVTYTAVTRRIREAPLHLFLPRSEFRLKTLLSKLLLYHYGCLDGDVTYVHQTKLGGIFTTEIVVHLPALCVYSDSIKSGSPHFMVAQTAGTSKKRTKELAMVEAMQRLFPDVFEQQIAYHPQVREALQSDKASVSGDAAPHVSRGLETQLRWALQTREPKADFVLESTLLKPSTPYPLWGVCTGTSTVWLTQLFLVKASPPKEGVRFTRTPVRELCTHAFGNRKSRSEQTAVAATLAKQFPELCKASVQDAKDRGLLDGEGAPTASEGVQPIADTNTTAFSAALSSDPYLTKLIPTHSAELQPLPWTPPETPSALEQLWSSLIAAVSAKEGTSLTVRVQRIGHLAASYMAQCLVSTECAEAAKGAEDLAVALAAAAAAASSQMVLCEATATTEIGALLALLATAEELGAGATVGTSRGEGSEDIGSASKVFTRLEKLPSVLPTTAPLRTCADGIRELYGLHCAVRLVREGVSYAAELWGTHPVDSGLLKTYRGVASSPFFLDRTFLLGRGYAESPLMAVVQAAQQVFEAHVRVHQRAFPEPVVMKGHIYLHPAPHGNLARLCDGVLAEIRATSDKPLTDSSLSITFGHNALFDLSFTVSSGNQTIPLEGAASRNLVDGLREFCQRLSTETRAKFPSPTALSDAGSQTKEQLLRQLCLTSYGLPLHVETRKVHQRWHCRVSLALTEELRCCVAEGGGNRKRDAVEAVAGAALQRYFATELPQIPAYAALTPASGADAPGDGDASTAAASVVSTETYIFHAVDAPETISTAALLESKERQSP